MIVKKNENMKKSLSTNYLSSPNVADTLNFLQERLVLAEEQTKNLSSKLKTYGFKRISAENHNEENSTETSKEISHQKYNPNEHDVLVERIGKMETVIASLHSGIKSLGCEKLPTKLNKVIQEKNEIKRRYKHELQKIKNENLKYKESLINFNKAHQVLQKEVTTLKEEITGQVETENKLRDQLNKQNEKLACFQGKIESLSKQNFQHNDQIQKLTTDNNEFEEQLQLKCSEIDQLEEQCKDERDSALTAQQNFEKELSCRIELEKLLDAHEKDFEKTNQNLANVIKENAITESKIRELEEEVFQLNSDTVKLKGLLDKSINENQKLKESLKSAAVDNQALLNQNKELMIEAKKQIDETVKKQDKILNCAKDSLLKEVSRYKENIVALEKYNLSLQSKLEQLEKENEEREINKDIFKESKTLEMVQLEKEKQSIQTLYNEFKYYHGAQENKSKQQLKSILQEKKQLAVENHKMKNLHRQLNDEIQKLKEQNNLLNEKLSDRSLQYAESQKRMENKVDEVINLKNDLAHEKELLQMKVQQLEEELTSNMNKRLETSQLASEIQSIQALYDDLKYYHDTQEHKSKQQLESIFLEKKQLVTENNRLKSSHNQLSSEIRKLKQESCLLNEKLSNEISQNVESQKSLKNKLNEMIDRKNELNHQRGTLEIKIHQLEKELANNPVHKLQELETKHQELNSQYVILMENEIKRKMEIVNLKNECKNKDNELQKYISQRYEESSNMKKIREESINLLKEKHKKEVQELQKEILSIKQLMKDKDEKYEKQINDIKKFSNHIEMLEHEKKLYMDKNQQQDIFLKTLMDQISELQIEITHIAETQNEATILLQEKEIELGEEKNKRRSIKSKYKALLKENTPDEVKKRRKPLLVKKSNDNCDTCESVNALITKEKYETTDVLQNYRNAMRKSSRKINSISDEITNI